MKTNFNYRTVHPRNHILAFGSLISLKSRLNPLSPCIQRQNVIQIPSPNVCPVRSLFNYGNVFKRIVSPVLSITPQRSRIRANRPRRGARVYYTTRCNVLFLFVFSFPTREHRVLDAVSLGTRETTERLREDPGLDYLCVNREIS